MNSTKKICWYPFKRSIKNKRLIPQSAVSLHHLVDPVVVINVSGMRYETFESTLARFPGTLLGSAERRQHLKREGSDEIFLDRNRSMFEAVLFFYQSNVFVSHL